MTVAIVYDSIFGNTAQIAGAMADALAPTQEVRLLQVSDAGGLDLSAVDLLIVGSPTRGFRPTPAITDYVGKLKTAAPGARRAAVFDTRLDLEDIHPVPLRWVISAGGYAADRLAAELLAEHVNVVGTPAGFLVEGTEGPLKPGELERARVWALGLVG